MYVDEDEFQKLINQALGSLPGEHVKNIKNVAILYALEPTEQQRERLRLTPDRTLLGLYEGTPLSQRLGTTPLYPDKITLFKGPLERNSPDVHALQENIRHTLWHEIAHYYGLDHDMIRQRESGK